MPQCKTRQRKMILTDQEIKDMIAGLKAADNYYTVAIDLAGDPAKKERQRKRWAAIAKALRKEQKSRKAKRLSTTNLTKPQSRLMEEVAALKTGTNKVMYANQAVVARTLTEKGLLEAVDTRFGRERYGLTDKGHAWLKERDEKRKKS